jgi:hypothetical protein
LQALPANATIGPVANFSTTVVNWANWELIMFNKTILAMSLAGLAGISVAQADSHSMADTAVNSVTDTAGAASSVVTDVG